MTCLFYLGALWSRAERPNQIRKARPQAMKKRAPYANRRAAHQRVVCAPSSFAHFFAARKPSVCRRHFGGEEQIVAISKLGSHTDARTHIRFICASLDTGICRSSVRTMSSSPETEIG